MQLFSLNSHPGNLTTERCPQGKHYATPPNSSSLCVFTWGQVVYVNFRIWRCRYARWIIFNLECDRMAFEIFSKVILKARFGLSQKKKLFSGFWTKISSWMAKITYHVTAVKSYIYHLLKAHFKVSSKPVPNSWLTRIIFYDILN